VKRSADCEGDPDDPRGPQASSPTWGTVAQGQTSSIPVHQFCLDVRLPSAGAASLPQRLLSLSWVCCGQISPQHDGARVPGLGTSCPILARPWRLMTMKHRVSLRTRRSGGEPQRGGPST
jgi:hypothetical protein